MNEIVQEFLVETSENLDQLDQDLVALERDPSSRELLASIFRTIHTVKGTTGFLGFRRLEDVSHAAESLLSDLRDGRLVLSRARTDVLLEVVDSIRGLLGAIEATGEEDDRDLSALVERIQVLQRDEPNEAEESSGRVDAPAVGDVVPAPRASAPVSEDAPVVEEAPARPKLVVPPPPPFARAVAPAAEPAPEVAKAAPARKRRATKQAPATTAAVPAAELATAALGTPGPADAAPLAPVVVDAGASGIDAPPHGDATPGQDNAAGEQPTGEQPTGEQHSEHPTGTAGPTSVGERSVRVDVDLLDKIMRQVGELVLARNQISSHAGLSQDQSLHQTVQRLSMIVSELQEGVMKTRMQPVEHLWNKVPRVVRDLSAMFDKQVRLEMEGGETELDRSLLEAVKDPLTHLVRNAIDHGLETPERRRAAGKSETGTMTLRAYHEGGQVVLEVADDGAGIDPQKIAAVALERQVVTSAELNQMSERELVDLVFRPGFSTAKAVTNVSGRGVGMDVVRTNVERIGGTIDLLSTPGAGTTFRVKIPLTLAIVPALLVGCRSQRYAIPQANLLELVQLRPEEAGTHLERIEGATVYRLRGKLLPLVRLEEVLGFAPEATALRRAAGDDLDVALTSGEATTIVVVQSDDLLLGVVVDDVFGTEEIVVKPLGQHVKQIPVFAGATILGDGGVALILDVPGLAAAAQVHEVSRNVAAAQAARDLGGQTLRAEQSTFVLLRVGAERQVAVPLTSVSRLEEAAADAIEHAGGRLVLQYRGELLPLVRLEEVLGEPPAATAGAREGGVPLVVYSDGERHLGLVASEILDIVEGVFDVRQVGASSAIVGSTVVNGHATDVLDVRAALELTEGSSRVA
ncbi:MAG: chemotaxis protein CheA [Actinomycetota bacterium]|nr:chemotaxis protein CheA [Actinomycetota bacterium]